MLGYTEASLGNEQDEILIDSGLAYNCCPPWCGSGHPLRPATGEPVPLRGTRMIKYELEDDSIMAIA